MFLGLGCVVLSLRLTVFSVVVQGVRFVYSLFLVNLVLTFVRLTLDSRGHLSFVGLSGLWGWRCTWCSLRKATWWSSFSFLMRSFVSCFQMFSRLVAAGAMGEAVSADPRVDPVGSPVLELAAVGLAFLLLAEGGGGRGAPTLVCAGPLSLCGT